MIQPKEIKEEIKARPPLQRVDAVKNYQGIKISWKLKFKNIRPVSSGENAEWEVHAEPDGRDMFPDIYIEINKNLYPELNITHEDTLFWVDGVISKVESNGLVIRLTDSVIRFNEHKNEVTAANTFINSQVHLGSGDNIARDKVISDMHRAEEWYEKWWGQLILAVAAGAVIYYMGWH